MVYSPCQSLVHIGHVNCHVFLHCLVDGMFSMVFSILASMVFTFFFFLIPPAVAGRFRWMEAVFSYHHGKGFHLINGQTSFRLIKC